MEENDAGKVRPKPTAKPKQSKAKALLSLSTTKISASNRLIGEHFVQIKVFRTAAADADAADGSHHKHWRLTI